MILFNTREHNDYSTKNETWDRINYPKMTLIVRVAFLNSIEVADTPDRIMISL